MLKPLNHTTSTVSLLLVPHGDNKRNSEGDFIRLKDGRILFAFSYYHGEDAGDHARCDIRAVYSDDNGRSFDPGTEDGEARLLISAESYGEKNVMSVTLMRMENGDLGLFYLLKHRDITDHMFLSRSADEGETFYETTEVLPCGWKGYYVVNNSRVVRLSSGRLMVPAARHDTACQTDGPYDGRSDVCFYCSDDDGRTWNRHPVKIPMPTMTYCNSGLQEPGLLELPNGDLYAYMRTDLGRQYEALSPDGGDTWFGAQPSRFTSPCSPMTLAKNPYTGRFYAIWNPIPNYNGRNSDSAGRTPLVMTDSPDGLHYDIDHAVVLEDDPGRGYCYTAVFFADADTMLLGYCSGSPAEDGSLLARLTIRRIHPEEAE